MIKRAIAISLITIYCLIIFKDFIPELVYELNFDYIVQNLCEQKDEPENLCMGHCYLNKKVKDLIAEEKKTKEDSKSVPVNYNLKTLEVHFAASKNFEIDFNNLQTNKQFFYNTCTYLSFNNTEPLLPPPKLIFS